MAGSNFVDVALDQWHVAQALNRDHARPEPIVEIMAVIGDVVGQRRHLRLGGGKFVEPEIVPGIVTRYDRRQRSVLIAAVWAGQRAVVLHKAFQHLPGQVQAIKARIFALNRGDHTQALGVVIKAAIVLGCSRQRPFPGMAERRMAEIMRQGQRFGEILIQPQLPGNGTGDLRHLNRVSEPRPVMISLVIEEHLRFVCQTPERR